MVSINKNRIIGCVLMLLTVFFLFSCRSITFIDEELSRPDAAVYFSFDDGPNPYDDTTARVLDVLARYGIRAFFSLLGENAAHAPELVRRIHDEGHYIVNHGYSNKLAHNMNDEEFRINLLKGEAAITAALGKELHPRLYRPHGGLYSPGQEEIWREAGYTMLPSNIRIYDSRFNEKDNEKAIRRVIKKVEQERQGIVLLHDGLGSYQRMEKRLKKNPRGIFNRSWIPGALEEIINRLLEKGFILNGPELFPIP